MKERIFGIETEFGLELLDENNKILFEDNFDKKMARKEFLLLALGIEGRGSFTALGQRNFKPNGSRVYKDVGNHIEYGTPECRSAKDAVIYDKAGELLVHEMISKGREREQITEKFMVFKNNLDSVYTTRSLRCWGCHENYMIPQFHSVNIVNNKRVVFRKEMLFHLIIPFVVTRQIYGGAGWFFLGNNIGTQRASDKRPFYILSQRAPFVSSLESSEFPFGHTRAYPLHKQMISRKASFGANNFQRLEIRVGESNLAEWSTYLKIGTTAIVLRMIEDGFLTDYLSLDNYTIRDPLLALKEIASDISCRKRTVGIGNLRAKPSEVQRSLYLEPAKVYLTRYGASEEEKDIMEKWEYVLNTIDKNPLKLSDRLDAWIRFKLLLDYRKKHRILWNHWKLGALNFAYDNIDRKRSVFYRIQELGAVKRIVTDKEICLAKTNPPDNTRAKLRGQMVGLAEKNNWFYEVDWNIFMRTLDGLTTPFLGEDKEFFFDWSNPFQCQDKRVDKLIEKYGL